MSFRWFALLLLAPAVACGDSSTAPDPIDVAGNWSYIAEFKEEDCTAAGTLEIDLAGSGFTGRLTGAAVSCGGQTARDFTPQLTGGRIEDGEIQFEMLGYRHRGALSGSRMEGTAMGRLEVAFPTDVEVVDGPMSWEATR